MVWLVLFGCTPGGYTVLYSGSILLYVNCGIKEDCCHDCPILDARPSELFRGTHQVLHDPRAIDGAHGEDHGVVARPPPPELVELDCLPAVCPDQKTPFWAVKHPPRPNKNTLPRHKTDSLWETLRARNCPGRARTGVNLVEDRQRLLLRKLGVGDLGFGPHCHFALPLTHSIPYSLNSLRDSAPPFLKRRCDRTLALSRGIRKSGRAPSSSSRASPAAAAG